MSTSDFQALFPSNRRLLPRLVIGFLMSGCTQSENMDAPSDAGTDSPDMITQSSITVSGTRKLTHVAEPNKLTTRAIDLSSATLEALIPDGSASGYTIIRGSGNSDGSFNIPGMSRGASYYLHYYNPTDSSQHQYFYTSAESLDLGQHSGQRSDVATGPSSTTLSWDKVSGLDAWKGTDQLLYYSSDNELYRVGSSPSNGSIVLNQVQSFVGLPLLSSARGDKMYVLQLHESTSSGGEVFQSLTKALELSNLDLTSGTSTTVSGTTASFSAAPMQTVSLDFRRSQFAAFQSSVSPAANPTTVSYSLYVSALLGGAELSYGFYTNSADLLAYATTASGDVVLDQVQFGNPFSSSYGLIGDARASFVANYSIPGATTGVNIGAAISRTESLATIKSGPITPRLGPVQALQINGQDAYTNTASVGTQPVLSWSAPQLGTPSGYLVSVIRLSLQTGTTRTAQTVLASIQTTQTRVTLPPGLLQSGEYYVFRVSSFARDGFDTAHPLRWSFPSYNAATLTTRVTP